MPNAAESLQMTMNPYLIGGSSIDTKTDWKRLQEFSKIVDSERNKQHQRVLCNEIRRLPNETIKQLAVRIETLVPKAYSLNTHDNKNTKMTKILLMTLIPQLRKIAIKKEHHILHQFENQIQILGN